MNITQQTSTLEHLIYKNYEHTQQTSTLEHLIYKNYEHNPTNIHSGTPDT